MTMLAIQLLKTHAGSVPLLARANMSPHPLPQPRLPMAGSGSQYPVALSLVQLETARLLTDDDKACSSANSLVLSNSSLLLKVPLLSFASAKGDDA
ncbi:hypothetical protein ACO22_00400 [Paracoccidioides brasiliensis]|uniref:Uncharacterized protein n=1 Tax=Paracoccidioides brasiliensis TaxID=121759 RepID=A0A1D2JPK8_PARBR|nr:hypothetical protein ACO22_00400 [Paracoccidioides brasiliensis]